MNIPHPRRKGQTAVEYMLLVGVVVALVSDRTVDFTLIDLCTTNDKKNQEAKVEILTTTNIGKEKVSKAYKESGGCDE